MTVRHPDPRGYRLTKFEGAKRQLLAAMWLYIHGQYECAVTLAGAAEGMLPKLSTTVHKLPTQDGPSAWPEITESERSDFLNMERNWLQHCDDREPFWVGPLDGWFMIDRAVDRLRTHPDWSPEDEAAISSLFARIAEVWE